MINNNCEYFECNNCMAIDVRNCEGNIDELIEECKDNPNCYYKQLQRKTAECENNLTAYKNELTIYDTECGKLVAEIDNLLIENENKSAECEKLKSALEEIEKFCYRGLGNCDGNETECNISLILGLINKAKEQE